MKVYIVQTCEYHDTTIHGVYATREQGEQRVVELTDQARAAAQTMIERRRTRDHIRGYNPEDHIEDWRDHYMVTEYEVIGADSQ